MLHRARHCGQASSLVKTKDDVGALDRLARSTLAQIVDGARRHQHARTLVERKADLGGIGTDNRSRLGLLAGIEHAHKGTTGVELLVMVDGILKSQRFESLRCERQRHRREQAALERCQVRSKDDAIGKAQNLLDFWRMAMFSYAIGLQILVRAAKMGAGVALLTGTRHATDGVDDYGAALGHPARTHGRRGSKTRCGGIATGAGDQHGSASGMAGSSGL